MKAKIFFPILILALASMACGFNVNLPKAPTPGPDITDEIKLPSTGADETNLKLSFGAGEIDLAPGAKDNLVEGTATYNYDKLKPIVSSEGDNNASITMGDLSFTEFPNFNGLKNKWDFKLGSDAMALTIEAGAYDATYEFGGLSLTNLTVKDGAADVTLDFSELNKSEMSIFKYETGASNIKMTGLANANFSSFTFNSGAGDYTLDFSGDLQRDATVNIQTGLSNLILVIPEGVNAVVNVDSGVSNVNATNGWEQNGDTYKQSGDGPTLTFIVQIGAGNLTLSK